MKVLFEIGDTMGFFNNLLRKANGLPPESEAVRAVKALREQIASLQAMALYLDRLNDDADDDISLFVYLRMDLLNFALHIASSDNYLDENEVAAINMLIGTDLSYSNCKSLIEDVGLGSSEFNQTIPNSFKVLTEIAAWSHADTRQFADALIETYRRTGIVIGSVDGNFDAEEKRDLNNYISMLEEYARRF